MDDCESLSSTLVVGAGLIGASIGLALSAVGVRVHLVDKMRTHALVAASRGAGSIEPPDPDDVRLVVVATPPQSIASAVARALRRYPEAAVTDVGSVKSTILAELGASGVGAARYVGSHPMAGSQMSGPLSASASLFEHRAWVITARSVNPPQVVARVRALAELCGARLVEMDPTSHDTAVAQVSHVPQLVSSLVGGRLRQASEDSLRLAGQGVRDVTRIAGSDPGLWRQILAANAPAVRAELDQLRADLEGLLAVLDDPDAVEDFLERGREGAMALPGKHGWARQEYASVVVEIPDEPNALGRLFTEVGELGVNVEELHISHADVREVGYLSIDVAPMAAEGLRDQLTNLGWTLRP